MRGRQVSKSSNEVAEILHRGLVSLGVPSGEQELAKLTTYLAGLERWNRAYNLTARAVPGEAVRLHVLDSATALDFLRGEVLDVGTGAGLPGLVLAILDPGRSFTLLDSAGKKLRFVRQMVVELGLDNVGIVHERAEGWKPRGLFDTVICRAYSSLGAFAETAGHLVAAGGQLLAMKGRQPEDELHELSAGWRAVRVDRVRVPGLDAERRIVVLERG